METITLLKKVRKKHSIQEVAEMLNIHTGTINRWCQQERVPNAYQHNLLKILGYKTTDGIQKDQFYTHNHIAITCKKHLIVLLKS